MKVYQLAGAVTALAMCTALPVMADDNKYTITIKEPEGANVSINGETYSAYRIFDMTYNADKTSYSYTVAEDFKTFTYSPDSDKSYKGDELISYIRTLYEDSDALNAFAAAVYSYIANSRNDPSSKPILPSGSAEAQNGSAVIHLNQPGWYLVYGTATAGNAADDAAPLTSAAILTNTDSNALVTPKVQAPTITKSILEADDVSGKGTAVNVGDTVKFQLASFVPSMTGYDTYKFIFHDTLSDGLTLDWSSITVEIGGTELSNEKYQISGVGQELSVTIPDLNDYKTGDAVMVTYNAVLNGKALTTSEENNEAYLEYSNNPYDGDSITSTNKQHTYVYDFDLKILKKEEDSNNPLGEASFVLYKYENSVKLYYQFSEAQDAVDDSAVSITSGATQVNWVTEQADATVMKTANNGFATFAGIEEGTYYLQETQAPAGYDLLKNPIEITISPDYEENGQLISSLNIKVTATASDTKVPVDMVNENGQITIHITVPNTRQGKLPGTGGIGNGGYLAVGAAVILVIVALMLYRRKHASPAA